MNARCCDCKYFRKVYTFDKPSKNKHAYFMGQTDLDRRPFCSKVGAVIVHDPYVDKKPWWCR